MRFFSLSLRLAGAFALNVSSGAALLRAQKELDEAKHLDPQQYEHLQGLIRYSGVQLAVKRRRR